MELMTQDQAIEAGKKIFLDYELKEDWSGDEWIAISLDWDLNIWDDNKYWSATVYPVVNGNTDSTKGINIEFVRDIEHPNCEICGDTGKHLMYPNFEATIQKPIWMCNNHAQEYFESGLYESDEDQNKL